MRFISRDEACLADLAATLDLMPVAVVLLDAGARCIATNDAADRLMAEAIPGSTARQPAFLADPTTRRRILEAIAATLAADGAARRVVAIAGRDERRFAAHVLPLAGAPADRRAVAALVVQEIGQIQPLPDETLMTLFGFTPAEARLASLIARDVTLSDAARTLGVARTTARSHLQALFAKTGTNQRTMLVKLLLSVLPHAPSRQPAARRLDAMPLSSYA